MHDGCILSRLYTSGMMAAMAAGGAESERRDKRLIKEATRVAGRWLRK